VSIYLQHLQVNRRLHDIIDESHEVQYLVDLYAAGLEVGYQDPSLTVADRRKQLDRYRSHWDSFQWVDHKSLPIPYHMRRIIEGGMICFVLHPAAFEDPTTDYRFIQLPSILRDIPLKEWTVHGLPNDFQTLGLLPEEDLLVICSLVDRGRYGCKLDPVMIQADTVAARSFAVQLLRMSDGQPHPNASIPILNGPKFWLQSAFSHMRVRLTCSRIAVTAPMLTVPCPSSDRVPRLIVWDWKTGVMHVVSTQVNWRWNDRESTTLQDVSRRSQNFQFVDEYRIFGASTLMSHRPRWSVTLLDTSAPVDDPHKPREIEFALGRVGSFDQILLTEGTYAQGARLGSPFRTDRKRHVLSIKLICAPEPSQSFVIDYGSICTIASENEAASSIPWNLWKHKTTPFDRDTAFTRALGLVGPRVLELRENPRQGSPLRLFDFTPGACRFTKQINTSSDDISRYAIRRAKLMDALLEGRTTWCVFSEDNVLAFLVRRRVSFERGALLFTVL
jgi:hypothetical protein